MATANQCGRWLTWSRWSSGTSAPHTSPHIRDNRLADVHEPITDSRDVFIHGLLDDDPNRRWGTCASIPVLITAVARRLGYPVGLAVAGRHIYARWEDDGVCFNIEASNPMGMTVPSDDEFRDKIRSTPGVPGEEQSGYYLRTLHGCGRIRAVHDASGRVPDRCRPLRGDAALVG